MCEKAMETLSLNQHPETPKTKMVNQTASNLKPQSDVSCRKQVNNKKNIQEKDSFQRINFLFQAAQLVATRCPNAKSVPAFYGSIIHSISQKSLIRMHPNMKRAMCRGCRGPLIPDVTSYVRVRPRPCCRVIWTCNLCGTQRTLPARRGYRLWIEKPEAIVSVNQC